jgi:CheY-like chemotaxis protein
MDKNSIDPILNSHVLLVEDSRDHQFIIIKRLNELGIQNITVSDTGEQAIDTIKSDPIYDIVLVDYVLPGLSGLDIIREIRLLDPEIPIIMITGLGSEQIAVQAMKLGIQDYIRKEDIFKTDFREVMVPLLLERRLQQETVLAKRLEENPNQLSITVFKFSSFGPEPVLTTDLPFEFADELEKETFLIKVGTQFMSATGGGHEYSQGLYELPVPGSDKYHSLVYAFRMKEELHSDKRIQQNGARNYGLVAVIFPVLYRSILPNRSLIERRLKELLETYSDIAKIDTNFLTHTRKIFLTKK